MLWLYKTGVFVSKIDFGFTGISDAEYLTNRKVKRATLNADNQGEYIRFYTDKDGKWAKYANSHTGEVGWVDLGQIEQDKPDSLRKRILDNLNDRVKYYNNQLSSLSELKNKINKASYQELQRYQYGNAQGFIKTFRAWLGNYGKMHQESNDYRF